MNNYCIYKIVSPTNKTYIGITNNFNRRMCEHKSEAINRLHEWALHRSIRKYGFDNHKTQIIFENLEKDEAQYRERILIDFFELQNSKIGLNSRKGGSGGNIIDWLSPLGKSLREKANKKRYEAYLLKWDDKKEKIIELVKTKTIKEICDILSVSETALTNYMSRMNIKCPIKKKYDPVKVYEDYLSYKKTGMTDREITTNTYLTRGTIYRAKQQIRKE